MISEVYVVLCLVWQLPLDIWLFYLLPVFSRALGILMTTALTVPTGVVVDDYRLDSGAPDKWLWLRCDHGLDANNRELGPKRDLSLWLCTRMIDNPRLIHTTGGR